MQNKSKLYSFLSELYDISGKSFQGHLKPQKLILLISVFDLIDINYINDNKIFLDNMLVDTYTKYHEYFKRKNDTNRPWYPFFHLRSSSFWAHKIKLGFEKEYKILSSEQGIRRINSIIDYSYLSENAYELFLDRKSRVYIENVINIILNENAE